MPIYAYRCDSCGFEKDHLQKLNDPALVTCPQCHRETYRKQVTAAGFLLKGDGWYATDFRDKGKGKGKGGDEAPPPAKADMPPACQCCPGAQACAGS
ncbi:MAG: zinc ribbon domain-containing protein [Candidatus Accumulibacter sp.]|jgi:putative FmdB family regulatory protein|nr:zinc ribbon domain-containing protein [Accumulibacter sp.]